MAPLLIAINMSILSTYAHIFFEDTRISVEFSPPLTLDMYSFEEQTLYPPNLTARINMDSTV